MEYCCHISAAAPSCFLELLNKLQKQVCRTVGPSFPVSLEHLAHHRNVVSLSLFYRYYFSRCLSELAQVGPFPYSWGRSTSYSDRLYDFSVTAPRCYNDVYKDWNKEFRVVQLQKPQGNQGVYSWSKHKTELRVWGGCSMPSQQEL